MTDDYCDLVKQGRTDSTDFDGFLHHLRDCKDCMRRIYSRMVIDFKQKETGDK